MQVGHSVISSAVSLAVIESLFYGAEIQSEFLPLLVPSPNQKNVHGEHREMWVINPSSKSARHKQMFFFFGSLLAHSLVNKETLLDLDLPRIFWKKLK